MTDQKVKNWKAKLLRPARRGASRFLKALPFTSATLGPPKGMLESTPEWIERHGTSGSVAWQVEAAKTVQRRLAPTLEPQLFEEFLPFLNQLHPAGQLFRIEGARLLHLCVLTPDDYILKDISFHREVANKDFDWILSALKLPRAVRVEGNLTIIGETFASSYYHWLFYSLGRLCYVTNKFALNEISYFAVSHLEEMFQRESLSLMGIPSQKILLLKDFPHIAPDAIVVPNWTGPFDPNIVDFLRKTFLPHVKSGPATSAKRLYLSRARAKGRQVENEEELLASIEPLGFQRIFCEDLSFVEEISLFNGAEFIIAPHGAGLSNLVFCKPGTKVIEIFNPDWRTEIFWQISEAVGLKHYWLVGNDPPNDMLRVANQHKNIRIDMEQFKRLFKLVG